MQNMLKKTVKCELVYTYKVNDRKMTLIFIAKTARFIVTIFRPSGGLRDHAKSTKQKMTVKIPVPPLRNRSAPFSRKSNSNFDATCPLVCAMFNDVMLREFW